MAYVSSPAKAPVSTATSAVLSAVANAFERFGTWLVGLFDAVAEAQSRVKTIEALQNLSDRQLEDQFGITRDQIVAYVYRDRFYV